MVLDSRADFRLLPDLQGAFDLVVGDVRVMPEVLRVIREHGVDRVIHLAAFLPPSEAQAPVTSISVNVGGTQAMLEAAVASGVRRFVFTSSKGVFGSFTGQYGPPSYEPVPEDAAKAPAGLYDIAKLTAEHLLGYYQRTWGLETVALRFPVLYGPGRLERHGLVGTVSRLLENALAGVPIEVPGVWEDELLYTRDCARGILLALAATRLAWPVYHVGLGRIVTLEEVASAVRQVVPGAVIHLRPGDLRPEPRAARLDFRRAREDLGYAPAWDLVDGLRDYASWMGRLGLAPTVT